MSRTVLVALLVVDVAALGLVVRVLLLAWAGAGRSGRPATSSSALRGLPGTPADAGLLLLAVAVTVVVAAALVR